MEGVFDLIFLDDNKNLKSGNEISKIVLIIPETRDSILLRHSIKEWMRINEINSLCIPRIVTLFELCLEFSGLSAKNLIMQDDFSLILEKSKDKDIPEKFRDKEFKSYKEHLFNFMNFTLQLEKEYRSLENDKEVPEVTRELKANGLTPKTFNKISHLMKDKGYFFRGEIFKKGYEEYKNSIKKSDKRKYYIFGDKDYTILEKKILEELGAADLFNEPGSEKVKNKIYRDIKSALFDNAYNGDTYLAKEIDFIRFSRAKSIYEEFVFAKHGINELLKNYPDLRPHEIAVICANKEYRDHLSTYFASQAIPFFSNSFKNFESEFRQVLKLIKFAAQKDLNFPIFFYNQHILSNNYAGNESKDNNDRGNSISHEINQGEKDLVDLDLGSFADQYDLVYLSGYLKEYLKKTDKEIWQEDSLLGISLERENLERFSEFIISLEDIHKMSQTEMEISKILSFLDKKIHRVLSVKKDNKKNYSDLSIFTSLLLKVFGEKISMEELCDYFLAIFPPAEMNRLGDKVSGVHVLTLDDLIPARYKHLFILNTEENIFLKNNSKNLLFSESGNDGYEKIIFGYPKKDIYKTWFAKIFYHEPESIHFILPEYSEETIVSHYMENLFRVYPTIKTDIYIYGEKEKIKSCEFSFTSENLKDQSLIKNRRYPVSQNENSSFYEEKEKKTETIKTISWNANSLYSDITKLLSSVSRVESFMKCPARFVEENRTLIQNIASQDNFRPGKIFHDAAEAFAMHYKGKDLIKDENELNLFSSFIWKSGEIVKTRLNEFAGYYLDTGMDIKSDARESFEFIKGILDKSNALKLYDEYMKSELERDANKYRNLMDSKIRIIKFLVQFIYYLDITDREVTATFHTEAHFRDFEITVSPSQKLNIKSGYIDFLYIDKDKKLVLIDFKSSDMSNYEEEIEKFDNVQLLIYKRVMEEALLKKDFSCFDAKEKNIHNQKSVLGSEFIKKISDNPPAKIKASYLSYKDVFEVTLGDKTLWENSSKEINFIDELKKRMGDGKEFLPIKNSECRYCSYYIICPESELSSIEPDGNIPDNFFSDTPPDLSNFRIFGTIEKNKVESPAQVKNIIRFKGDRSRALEENKKNIIISAGAGTGKTEVLSSKYIELLLRNEDLCIENIVCITFTNKAVGEMKKRIYRKIREAIESGINPSIKEKSVKYELTKNEIEKLKSARNEFFDNSKILTFHSFCLENLDEYAKFSGEFDKYDLTSEIAPDFILGDEKISYIKKNAADYFENILTGEKITPVEKGNFIEWFKKEKIYYEFTSISGGFLEDILYLIDKIHLSGRNFDRWEISYSEFVTRYKEKIEEEKNSFVELKNELIQFVEDKRPDEKKDEIIESIKENKFNRLSLKIKDKDLKKQFQDKLSRIKKESLFYQMIVAEGKVHEREISNFTLIEKILNLKREFAIRKALFIIAWNIYEHLEEFKRKKGFIEQADLHLRLLRLLEHPKEGKKIQEILKSRYKYLLVDEFQDTNWLQDMILGVLNEKGKNFLFIVGDLKQSIYRFQQCDNQIFSKYMKRCDRDKDFVYLTMRENYRSTPLIVNFNNHYFTHNELKNFNIFPITSRAQDDIEHAVSKKDNKSKSAIIFNEIVYSKQMIDLDFESAFRERELNQIAKIKEAEVIARTILLNDPEKKNLGSFGILIRSYTRINYLIETFKKHNIPYSFTMKQGLIDQPEVNVFLSIIKIILNTGSATTLPFFDMEKIKSLKKRIMETGILNYGFIYTVYYILHSLEFQDYLRSSGSYRQSSLHIRILIEDMINISRLYNENPFEILYHLERSGSDLGIESFDENSVRILTIHSAKGLEFENLFLINVSDTEIYERSGISFIQLVEEEGKSLIDFSVRKEKTEIGNRAFSFFLAQNYKRKNIFFEEMENANLLYVALTRAKENLFVSMLRNNLDTNYSLSKNFLKNLDANLFRKVPWEDETGTHEYTFDSKKSEKVLLNRMNIRDIQFPENSELKKRKPIISIEKPVSAFQEKVIPEIRSVSEIILETTESDMKNGAAPIAKNIRQTIKDQIDKEENAFKDTESRKITERTSPRDIGNFIHSFFEKNLKLILSNEFDFEKSFDEFKEDFPYKSDTFYKKTKAMLQKALMVTEFFDLIKGRENLYFEQPVLFKNEENRESFVYGVIDLLIEKNNKIIILDYKTHEEESGISGWLMEKHKNQLRLYEKAIRGIYPNRELERYLFVIGKTKAELVRV